MMDGLDISYDFEYEGLIKPTTNLHLKLNTGSKHTVDSTVNQSFEPEETVENQDEQTNDEDAGENLHNTKMYIHLIQ